MCAEPLNTAVEPARRRPGPRPWVLVAVLTLTIACGARGGSYQPADGDVVFHTSRSAQSLAIQKATRSPYSHMGIVLHRDGRPGVFEAVEPVRWTPLDEWIARGEGGHFVAKRLVDAETLLTPDARQRMMQAGEPFLGKHYDLLFEWSDERIYCSELVWKIYQRALGLEVGKLQTLSDFDLSDPLIQQKVQERWGGQPPGDEVVISPAAIFASDLLATVYER